MAVDEQARLAYASVTELTKQLITLSTGVVTLEVTFAKAFVPDEIAKHSDLQTSWVLLMLSIVAGVWVLMALTGSIARNATPAAGDVYESNVRFPALAQIVLFALGMAYTISFGFRAAAA